MFCSEKSALTALHRSLCWSTPGVCEATLANRYYVHRFGKLEATFARRFTQEESCDRECMPKQRPKLIICFDEHHCKSADAIGFLKEQEVATLQLLDGILAWRRIWEHPGEGRRLGEIANPA